MIQWMKDTFNDVIICEDSLRYVVDGINDKCAKLNEEYPRTTPLVASLTTWRGIDTRFPGETITSPVIAVRWSGSTSHVDALVLLRLRDVRASIVGGTYCTEDRYER